MNLYSIPVHECPECVKQMCDGILFFDNEAIIVLHVSKQSNINLFTTNDRIFINPIQYETNWGWDFTKIHISNYLFIKDQFSISYVIFLTSNMLMIKNPSEYIKNYDCGFSEQYSNIKITPPLLIKEYQINWLSDVLNDSRYLSILKELNTDKKYGCIIDGTFVNSYIMDKICYFYTKYYDNNDKYIHCLEEKIIPTIACNLTSNISESLLFFQTVNLSEFKELIKKNHDYFSKRINRDINSDIRQYYNTLIIK